MAPEQFLWGAISLLFSIILAYQHQRITRTEDSLVLLRVHIAEKYTTSDDLAELTAALTDVRKELARFREEFHNANLQWAKFTGKL